MTKDPGSRSGGTVGQPPEGGALPAAWETLPALGSDAEEEEDSSLLPRAVGSLAPAVEEIGAMAPGPRAFKTALAVGVAWWLASLLGEQRPVFAAIGALVGVEPTIVGSVRRTALQFVGVFGGILLALIFTHVASVSALVVGLAVGFGLWAGRLLRSPDRVGVELSVTALLVVTIGQGDVGFGVARLWETALGGLVATVTNALIFPPNYLPEVVRSMDDLVERTTTGLARAVWIFAERPRHEGAAETLDELRAARAGIPGIEERMRLARSAFRFSPLIRGQGPELARCRAALRLYTRAASHATRVARIVLQHSERSHDWSHFDLKTPSDLRKAAEGLARGIRYYQSYVHRGDPDYLSDVREELGAVRASLDDFMSRAGEERAATAVERFVDIAAVASELDHLALDLGEALAVATPRA